MILEAELLNNLAALPVEKRAITNHRVLNEAYAYAKPSSFRRTYHNITGLLESEGATWHDIVRTTCYLRDIERDYEAFNEERTRFFQEQGLDPVPASTGIQAILCRPELLIEIEAIAMFRTPPKA